jgi:uncharacterized membrane protein YeaQ/YmgE (transglycosylase-associated protein family)
MALCLQVVMSSLRSVSSRPSVDDATTARDRAADVMGLVGNMIVNIVGSRIAFWLASLIDISAGCPIGAYIMTGLAASGLIGMLRQLRVLG